MQAGFDAGAGAVAKSGNEIADHVEFLVCPDLGIVFVKICFGDAGACEAFCWGHPVRDAGRDHDPDALDASWYRPNRATATLHLHVSENTKSASGHNIQGAARCTYRWVMSTAIADRSLSLAGDLQELYRQTKARVGGEDLAHIRNVAAYAEAIRLRSLELLREQGDPRSVGRAVALQALYRLLEFSELGHNIVHGSYDHLQDCGEFHSERYQWGFNVDLREWKVMHHEGHHPNTNVIDKDHDLGYSVARGKPGQDWYAHHLAQIGILGAVAPILPFAAPFIVTNAARQVENRRFFSPATLRTPVAVAMRDGLQHLVREPLQAGMNWLPTLVGNYVGGVAGYAAVLTLVAIEHHAPNVEVFPDPGPDESVNDYYSRQLRATTNFVRSSKLDEWLERLLQEEVPFDNRPGFEVFYGGLDTHIEHHLFPDLPPNRQREIAPAVREIAARHETPYNEILIADVIPMAVKVLTVMSLPFGEREYLRPLKLLTQPASLVRRLGFGTTYRTLPEAPYLDKPRFYNVPVKVLSTRTIARGQARSITLQKPHGWDSVTWEAGAIVSIRVEIDDDILVRQYSLVRDSDDSDVMEICVKRVADGRVSNQLNDSLRAGKYVTLVGAPTATGGLDMSEIPERSLFVAGGVGITPIISLLRRIAREAPHSDAILLYFNRDDRSVIFERELRELARPYGIQVKFFTDKRSRRHEQARISTELLARHVPFLIERETYVCAPPVMIALAQEQLADLGLPPERFHTESFTPPTLDRPADDGQRFTVRFRRSNREIEIDSGTTLLEAAGRAGIRVPTGCERGLCRACVTPKLSGTTQHDAEGAQDRITVCNSLPCSDVVLDL